MNGITRSNVLSPPPPPHLICRVASGAGPAKRAALDQPARHIETLGGFNWFNYFAGVYVTPHPLSHPPECVGGGVLSAIVIWRGKLEKRNEKKGEF